MSILYEKVKRTVTVGRNPGQKYLAKVYVPSTIDEKQVALYIMLSYKGHVCLRGRKL